ncbi:ABC1 kinase family protein [Oceanobacillus alkalisoli]|uniref:ABC1 kinase family protein n=1 Tax=Oceanobacillus alkalisoli TaxID=2925113 RepID=UPI001F11F686|nr:AarF/UbiB family protein [Oceanobacillus alkalisoli]MCF3942785.1 AarF/UbiB family protein [Oceanobacillus alkalisoli]
MKVGNIGTEVIGLRKLLKYNFLYRYVVIITLTISFITRIYVFLLLHSVWDEQTKKKWNNLLYKLARKYRETAERLGGVLIKVGQFLSTRTDFLPDVFIQELTGLVDHVPPMPFENAEKILLEDWGKNMEEHVKYIKKQSVASASIGEVYYGILKGGQEVAIKVRRYRIEEVFHKDFVALRMVFWILKVFTNFGKKADLKALYHELVTVMERELDYGQELEFGQYFTERYGDMEHIHIPHFYEELSTRRILVMEWIQGEKITNTEFFVNNRLNREQISKNLFDFYIDQFLNPGKFHADPHAGNILLRKDGTVAIIDFGMIGEIKKQDTDNFKLLIQGFIIDNYDIVIDALDKMNFLLPHANKKKIKEVIIDAVEMYSAGSLKNLNTQTINQVFDEVSEVVKEQPIQLPADYAYLLRAISIVVGILYAINPEIDIVKWGKDEIKDWFGMKSIVESVTKQYVKNATDPLLSYPRALLNFLESGERDRVWDKEKLHIKMKHQYYLLLEVFSFIMVVAGTFISIYSYTIGEVAIRYTGWMIAAVFLILLNILLLFHRSMIRKQNKKGV